MFRKLKYWRKRRTRKYRFYQHINCINHSQPYISEYVACQLYESIANSQLDTKDALRVLNNLKDKYGCYEKAIIFLPGILHGDKQIIRKYTVFDIIKWSLDLEEVYSEEGMSVGEMVKKFVGFKKVENIFNDTYRCQCNRRKLMPCKEIHGKDVHVLDCYVLLNCEKEDNCVGKEITR